jgi:hypothetical protein
MRYRKHTPPSPPPPTTPLVVTPQQLAYLKELVLRDTSPINGAWGVAMNHDWKEQIYLPLCQQLQITPQK